MRECHLKMICNDRGDARREWTLKSDAIFVIKEGFEVHSALYGDGKSRYTDVTKTVQGWTEDALWPENWEELLYATRKPRSLVSNTGVDSDNSLSGNREHASASPSLTIRQAWYGFGEYGIKDTSGEWWRSCGSCYGQFNSEQEMFSHNCYDHNDPPNWVNVTERVRELVVDNSLDIVVSNSVLQVGNPFRGRKKTLRVIYDFDNGEAITRTVEEKDWLIIGPAVRDGVNSLAQQSSEKYRLPAQAYMGPAAEVIAKIEGPTPEVTHVVVGDKQIYPTTSAALNDYLIRKFSISPQRLRGPMPVEVPQFHRNDLAQLFAELGFKRGAEIGVAEGNYSEVLLKANPNCELLLVDPWHHYSENPQGKSKEKHEFAYNEVKRKTASYSNVNILPKTSMHVINNEDFYSVASNLDFCYIDGNHLFDYVMQDLIEWSKRVRSGGIVSGDDYYALDQKRWTGGGVVEAVQAYTKAHRISIWWLFAGHKSVDFMWVKP